MAAAPPPSNRAVLDVCAGDYPSAYEISTFAGFSGAHAIMPASSSIRKPMPQSKRNRYILTVERNRIACRTTARVMARAGDDIARVLV